MTWAAEAGYERIWAGVRVWNVASRRVLQKLGFRETNQIERDPVHGDSLLTVKELKGQRPPTTLAARAGTLSEVDIVAP